MSVTLCRNQPRLWFVCFIVVGLLISGCSRGPQARVLSVKRADGINKGNDEMGANIERPKEGMAFLMVTFDLGKTVDLKETLDRFNSSTLTDKQGKTWRFGGPGFGYDMKNPNQIELVWSVPQNQTSFTLAYGSQRFDLNAPQIESIVSPSPSPSPSPTVQRGVVIIGK